MEPKPGTVPMLSFSAGAATLTWAFIPELAATSLSDVIGIAALTAVITPFAMVGKACLARVTDRIAGGP